MFRRILAGIWPVSEKVQLPDLLVVGLGNPGKRYAATRHNVGASVLFELCNRYEKQLRVSKDEALTTEIISGNRSVILAFPQTFMNDSGRSTRKLVRRYKIEDMSKLVIVHDEMDLPVGVLKIKLGGGLAGHNGLLSISKNLRTRDYVRIRIGIGRPTKGKTGADYVLGHPGRNEEVQLSQAFIEAADAIELILSEGVDSAMRTYNT